MAGTCSFYPLSTIHCRWTVGPFRPSLVRGDSPRNAPLTPLLAQPVGSFGTLYNRDPSPRHPACADPACRQLQRGRSGRLCASPAPPFEFRASAVPDHCQLPTARYALSTFHCRHDFPARRFPPQNRVALDVASTQTRNHCPGIEAAPVLRMNSRRSAHPPTRPLPPSAKTNFPNSSANDFKPCYSV